MCSFDKLIGLILYMITLIKCERWYSATILERKNMTTILPNVDNDTVDIFSTKYKGGDFRPTIDAFHSFIPRNKNVSFVESDGISLRYNNTIKNRKNLREFRTKRRRISRNRCSMGKSKSKPKSGSKSSKFLEVFQVVEFEHVACTSSSGLEGKCLPEFKCNDARGSTMGTCADGYGTCCVTQFQCDERTNAETGWFTNPAFPAPSSERLSCAMAIEKSSEDIKQIRLDFNVFELLPPNDGVCQDDQFIVSGQNVNNIIPILCGINTGQHVYIEVGDVEGPIFLTFQTASEDNRLFAIKVSQLTSSDPFAAPPGCLQYFKQAQGYLESFNYRDKSDIGIARYSSYLNNLNYAMCIERVPDACSVTYTNAGHMQILNYDTDDLPIIPPGQAGVEILNCPSDWLLIAATRFCGDRFNDGSVFQDFTLDAPVTDYSAGPIVIWFRSDESYVGYGFKLLYQQTSCSSSK